MRYAAGRGGASAGASSRTSRPRPVFGPRRTGGAGAPGLGGRLRRLLSPRAALAAASFLLLLLLLASWHPGDATLRWLSDPPVSLLASPAGLSLGRATLRLRLQSRPLLPPPVFAPPGALDGWRSNLSEAARSLAAAAPALGCTAAVSPDAASLLLADGASLRKLPLSPVAPEGASWAHGLSCVHFALVRCPSPLPPTDASLVDALHAAAAAAARDRDTRGAAATLAPAPRARCAVVTALSAPAALRPYAAAIANRVAYSEDHGYAAVLTLVPPPLLAGRSPKFAKHFALGTLAASSLAAGAGAGAGVGGGGARGGGAPSPASPHLVPFDILLHADADAWFASWDRIEDATAGWPADKELLLPDAGQLWLNSGLLLARSTSPWTVTFFESVLDALHDTQRGEGFKRDQPAVWSALARAWRSAGVLPAYGGEGGCWAWAAACNPDANPVACWHACFWAPLRRGGPGWKWTGLGSLTQLPHLHMPPRVPAAPGAADAAARPRKAAAGEGGGNGGETRAAARDPAPPTLHRLCLASCPSALARLPGLLCGATAGRKSPLCALPSSPLPPQTDDTAQPLPPVGAGDDGDGASLLLRLPPPRRAPGATGAPTVDAMSRCDGAGCLAQLAGGGGAWVKHSGHQHWRDALPRCVPLDAAQAQERLADPRPACAMGAGAAVAG